MLQSQAGKPFVDESIELPGRLDIIQLCSKPLSRPKQQLLNLAAHDLRYTATIQVFIVRQPVLISCIAAIADYAKK